MDKLFHLLASIVYTFSSRWALARDIFSFFKVSNFLIFIVLGLSVDNSFHYIKLNNVQSNPNTDDCNNDDSLEKYRNNKNKFLKVFHLEMWQCRRNQVFVYLMFRLLLSKFVSRLN